MQLVMVDDYRCQLPDGRTNFWLSYNYRQFGYEKELIYHQYNLDVKVQWSAKVKGYCLTER